MVNSVAAFLLMALVIELTPGPNMAYLAMISVVEGRRAGLAATAGVALGLLMIGIAASLGLAALVAASPLAYGLLRWAGALYLVWLAAEAWLTSNEVSPGHAKHADSGMRYFRRGLVTNLLNPKAAVFYIAILPTFADPARAIIPQTLLLTSTYVLLATGIHLAIVLLAANARPWFQVSGRERVIRRIFSGMLILVAIWFLMASG